MDFSSIFVEKAEYSIQRIEEQSEGWNIYPDDEEKTPIFISRQQYAGKMPPTFKFFWQKRKLKLKMYKDIIISAELDGVLLFEVEKEAYPQKLKEVIAAQERKYQEYLERCKIADAQLQKEIADYLQLVPCNMTLEDDFSSLRVPLRAYLKLHFFKGTPSFDSQQRLTLMFILSQMAERIYKRHVRETDKKYSLDLSCAFATLKFSFLFGDDIWPDYRFDMKVMEDAVGMERAHESFVTYYEAQQLIEAQLPSCSDELKRYLNYIVRELLYWYAVDWEELQSHFLRDGFCSRLCSDEEDYQYRYEKMKLLHYTNFILPEKISKDKIDIFMQNFNLQ